jgi:hypothetical protein
MSFHLGTGLNKILGSELGEMIIVDIIVILLYLFKIVSQPHFIYAKLTGTALLTYLHFFS